MVSKLELEISKIKAGIIVVKKEERNDENTTMDVLISEGESDRNNRTIYKDISMSSPK